MIKTSIALLLVTAFSATATAQKTNYQVIARHTLGGTGSWDYINANPQNQKVYVSHGTRVVIMDEVTGDSTGTIPNTNGVHGIALVNSLGKGYTSNGRSNSVSVFNIKTNAVTGEIKTGQNPDAIFYDEYSKKIITCNGRSQDATVIDPATDQVVATIPLGGKPETAVSDGKGKIYINIEDTGEIARVNAVTFKVEQRWKLDGGEEPSGLAIDRATNRLITVCGNKVMIVLNTTNGKMAAKLPIGDGCDGVAFDETRKLAFSSNGEGTITVVRETDPNHFVVVQTVQTEARARTITIDQKNHHLYLPCADFKAAADGQRQQAVAGTFRVLEIAGK